MPVFELVVGGYRFFAANALRFAPLALLMAVSGGWLQIVARDFAVGMENATPYINITSIASGVALALVTAAAFQSAVLRLAVRGEFVGPQGFAFGIDELRLLGATLILMGAVLLVAALFAAIVFMLLGAEDAARLLAVFSRPDEAADPAELEAILSGGRGGLISLLFTLTLVVTIWASIRLSLVQPATIAENGIRVVSSMKWTRGIVFSLLAAIILTSAPLSLVIQIVRSAFVSLLVGGAPADLVAAPEGVLFSLGAVSGFLEALAALPTLAMLAAVYARMTERARS